MGTEPPPHRTVHHPLMSRGLTLVVGRTHFSAGGPSVLYQVRDYVRWLGKDVTLDLIGNCSLNEPLHGDVTWREVIERSSFFVCCELRAMAGDGLRVEKLKS